MKILIDTKLLKILCSNNTLLCCLTTEFHNAIITSKHKELCCRIRHFTRRYHDRRVMYGSGRGPQIGPDLSSTGKAVRESFSGTAGEGPDCWPDADIRNDKTYGGKESWRAAQYCSLLIIKVKGGFIMNRPENFEKMVEASSVDPLRLGGHYLVIKGVIESKNTYGEDMIIVQLDCDVIDDQAGYFGRLYDLDDRADKKWPYSGTQYITVVDGFTGACSRPFASFVAAVAKSNPGFKIDWDNPDVGNQFTNQKVGGVFGRVETDYAGEVRMRTELRYFCNLDRVDDAPVPKEKLLKPAAPVEATLRKNRPAV